MCRWGDLTMVEVEIPSDLSHTGKAHLREVGVDACIAGIVEALNVAGIKTRGSCCGHGKRDGSILLSDGRELVIRTAVAVACEFAVDPSVAVTNRSGL